MKNKKKIAYYTTSFSFNQFSLLRNFQEMLSDEFELHLFVKPKEYEKFEEQGLVGYKVHFFSGVRDLLTIVPKICQEEDIQVISNLVNFTIHGFHVSMIAKRAGIKSVGFVGIEHMLAYKRVKSLLFKVKLFLMKNLFGGFVTTNLLNNIQVLGPNLKKDIQKRTSIFSPDKVKILPQPIDTKKFKPVGKENSRNSLDLPLNDEIVLYVGRIDYLKGLDRIVEVAKEMDTTEFYVVGGGSWEQKGTIKKYVEELKRLNNAHFLGPVPHNKMTTYYNAADILFLPSRQEGLPHVLMEAMACGTPIVATDVGDISSLCPPGILADESNFQEKINHALKERRKLSKLCRKKITEEFSIAAMKRKYVNFFNQIIT